MPNDINTAPAGEKALHAIEQLVLFALNQELIQPADVDYSRNELLDQFGFSEPYALEFSETPLESPQEPLDILIDYGFETGLIPENTDTYRDLLDAKIMGLLMARPSEVNAQFFSLSAEKGIEAATDRFYKLSIDSNYIRMDRISKNVLWLQESPYGDIEMTINLSKPEKNPKEIAMARLLPPCGLSEMPALPRKCGLCRTFESPAAPEPACNSAEAEQ